VDRYFPVLDMLEHELDVIEQTHFRAARALRGCEHRGTLSTQAAGLMIMKHAVCAAYSRVGFKTLSGATPYRQYVPASGKYFRDISDHLQRLNQNGRTPFERLWGPQSP